MHCKLGFNTVGKKTENARDAFVFMVPFAYTYLSYKVMYKYIYSSNKHNEYLKDTIICGY